MPIIVPIPRGERRLMQKAIHKTRDKNHARRLTAMLMLHRGERVSDVARTLCCARSSVGRWINWFTHSGIEGLKSLPAGRSRRWPFEHICTLLRELIKHSPGDFGYQRSRWSTELLAIKINEITGCQLHAGTVRRWLPSAGLVWRRAAPTLRIRDPHKDEKMAVIHKALDECSAEHPVFYEDEVDIHLNPKIGADWQLRGQQKRVVTPGQNEKYYLAGALHSGTGKVSYVGGNSKSSALFIALLKHLKATYRRAKTITLIVDNYIIHKSRETQRWLKANPKFRVIYQPVYSPWVNHVERLWQALHDTITRNHQCRSMWQLRGLRAIGPQTPLMELKGVGPTTASALVASIGNAHDFKNGRQLAAWLGLTPSQYSSGGKSKLGRITKAGDAYLRTLLVQGARSVMVGAENRTDPFSRWVCSLIGRRGYWRAVVAIAAKNARLCWASLHYGDDFRLYSTT
ncbi:IS630 family transposase [Klebsiella pneumoniae]|uniref:Mobile element protein n=81 Tax=Gammaproteobacteria TaxID=1236 RepID=A0A3Q8CWJ6_KLEPN|nr:Mobile element protein [Klebsiella pneumoniae]